jgi:hypothetical protein
VQRLVVVSIIGTDKFTAGYGVAKLAHERAATPRSWSPQSPGPTR